MVGSIIVVAFRTSSSVFVSFSLFAVLAAAPTAAFGAGPPGKSAKLEPPAHRQPLQRSVGSPTEGHLIGGSHLTESPALRVVPVYQAGDARWGVEPLVSLIDHASKNVRKQFPDAVLSVGHLSRQGGGEIDRHASHESGRDADIGFYIRNAQNGKALYAEHFVAFKGDGTATSWPGAQFDDAKNWSLISTMVSDVHAHITHIFVSGPIRARLLSYAEKIGASGAIRQRASELMAQPKGSLPHDDHFHVRVQCPSGMDKCIEQPLARKHRPGQNPSQQKATAALAHAQQHGAKPHAAHPTPPGHPAVPSPPPHAAPSQPPKASSSSSEAKSEKDDSEAFVPSLAPIVPGLDSAVIPAPLQGVKPDNAPPPPPAPSTPSAPSPPPSSGIDDPDGVLEKH